MVIDKRESSSNERVRGVDQLVAALILLACIGLIVAYLWWWRFEYFKQALAAVTYTGVFLLVLLDHFYFSVTRQELGLRLDNLAKSLRRALLPHLVLLVAFLGLYLVSPRPSPRWSELSLVYLLWAFLQQYLLQNLVRRRLRMLVGSPRLTLLLAALVFAFLHWPNIALVGATLLGALLWCWLFQRTPNLLTVTLSHAVLGLTLAIFFKFDGLDQFEVGAGGYAYTTFGDGVEVAAGYDDRRRPVIVTLPGQDREHGTRVRVFSTEGALRTEWVAFPDYGFGGNLAVGDLGFGPGDEVVVAPGPGTGNPAEIKVFSLRGREEAAFSIPGQPSYGAYVEVSRGNILASPGPVPGQPSLFFEFSPQGKMLGEWRPGGVPFENGVKVLRLPEASRRDDRYFLFANFLSVNSSRVVVFEPGRGILDRWDTMGSAFGLNLTVLHLGEEDFGFAAAPGAAPGHSPHIVLLNDQGKELRQFFPFESETPCGANLAAVDTNGDFRDEIVLGGGFCQGTSPRVWIVDQEGKVITDWLAYP